MSSEVSAVSYFFDARIFVTVGVRRADVLDRKYSEEVPKLTAAGRLGRRADFESAELDGSETSTGFFILKSGVLWDASGFPSAVWLACRVSSTRDLSTLVVWRCCSAEDVISSRSSNRRSEELRRISSFIFKMSNLLASGIAGNGNGIVVASLAAFSEVGDGVRRSIGSVASATLRLGDETSSSTSMKKGNPLWFAIVDKLLV